MALMLAMEPPVEGAVHFRPGFLGLAVDQTADRLAHHVVDAGLPAGADGDKPFLGGGALGDQRDGGSRCGIPEGNHKYAPLVVTGAFGPAVRPPRINSAGAEKSPPPRPS